MFKGGLGKEFLSGKFIVITEEGGRALLITRIIYTGSEQ